MMSYLMALVGGEDVGYQNKKKEKKTKLTRMGSDMTGALHNVYTLYNKQHTDDRTLARVCGKHIMIGVA